MAAALAHKACRDGWKVLYAKTARLFSELAIARVDGTFGRRLMSLANAKAYVTQALAKQQSALETQLAQGNLDAFAAVHGVGAAKLKDFGKLFVAANG